MGAVPLVYSTSSLPGAGLIRGLTWGEWSHLAGIDEEKEEVIEAVWPRVRIVPLWEWLEAHPRHDISFLPAADPAAVIASARSQEGKDYDLAGALGLPFRKDWQDPEKWWCSELWAWSFQEGGSPLFRGDEMHRITPQHFRILAPAPPPACSRLFLPDGRLVRPSSFLGVEA